MIEDFEIQDGILTAYFGSDNNITIPDSVTEIGESAFEDSDIASVVIPNGVKVIGDNAFENCTFLKSINIADSVISIGFRAFAECDELSEITLPNGLTELQPGTFWGCTALRSVKLPESLKEIGGGAFQNCTALPSILIPESVTELGPNVFAFCSSFTSINIPKNIKVITASLFEECDSLRNISLPSTITTIKEYAFKLSGVKSVAFDGTKAQWDSIAKGKYWNNGTSLKVACTDSDVKEKNKTKFISLKDLKDNGMSVKVTSVTDWVALRDIPNGEAQLIWAANYALAKRRIGYITAALILIAATALCWYAYFAHLIGFMVDMMPYVIGVLTVLSVVCLIMMSFWRRLLNGYKYFCKLHGFPLFSGFGAFMFYFTLIMSTVFYIMCFLLIIFISLLLSFLTSSSSSSSSSGRVSADRLGIPQNIGHDDLIALGLAHDEAVYAEQLDSISSFLSDLDHTIAKNQIESDYQVKTDKIYEINKQIKELEGSEEYMDVNEKQKLKELKERSAQASAELTENYEQAKKELESMHDKNRSEL